MQIALHVLAYNVNRYLRPMLENAAPWVDKIYVAYPCRPFGYIAESRASKTNPTAAREHIPNEWADKIEVVEGDWEFEEETRNECLKRARNAGFDWLLIQDADEFFTEASWHGIRRALATASHVCAFKGTWYNFWKSSHHVIIGANGDIKGENAGLAIRCRPNCHFRRRREMAAENVRFLDEPCYHYGYVMSDAEMEEKLVTWSHAREFDPKIWFDYKWRRWTPATRYLNPVWPTSWDRAVRFPLPQPAFAHQFALDFPPAPPADAVSRLRMLGYDTKARLRNAARELKNGLLR